METKIGSVVYAGDVHAMDHVVDFEHGDVYYVASVVTDSCYQRKTFSFVSVHQPTETYNFQSFKFTDELLIVWERKLNDREREFQ